MHLVQKDINKKLSILESYKSYWKEFVTENEEKFFKNILVKLYIEKNM